MGMDELRCKTPSMVRKELMMYFIAYNAIRWLIYESSDLHDVDLLQISFKGAVQSVRHWEPILTQSKISKSERQMIMNKLRQSIIENRVLLRPGRREPALLKTKAETLSTSHG